MTDPRRNWQRGRAGRPTVLRSSWEADPRRDWQCDAELPGWRADVLRSSWEADPRHDWQRGARLAQHSSLQPAAQDLGAQQPKSPAAQEPRSPAGQQAAKQSGRQEGLSCATVAQIEQISSSPKPAKARQMSPKPLDPVRKQFTQAVWTAGLRELCNMSRRRLKARRRYGPRGCVSSVRKPILHKPRRRYGPRGCMNCAI